MPQSSPIAERPPVELPIPPEPAALRADVQRDPDRAPPIDELIVPILWEAWGETLAAEAVLREIAREYRYELWLWAMGERSWQQCAEGLAGRVRRRL